MKKIFTSTAFLLWLGSQFVFAIVPNPTISKGKTVYTSSGNKTYLTDNIFGSGNAFQRL